MFIGLTGTIGSGKSTVAKILSQNSNFIIHNSDKIAKDVINTDEGKKFIIENFGEQYIKEDNVYYEKLRDVFSDENKLKALTDYSHPLTEQEIRNNYVENKINIVESAILFETGWDKWCSNVIYVVNINFRRLLKETRNMNDEEIDLVLKIQNSIPPSKKVAQSKYVVDNSRGMKELVESINKLSERIINDQ